MGAHAGKIRGVASRHGLGLVSSTRILLDMFYTGEQGVWLMEWMCDLDLVRKQDVSTLCFASPSLKGAGICTVLLSVCGVCGVM